jgi:hypothetical protein
MTRKETMEFITKNKKMLAAAGVAVVAGFITLISLQRDVTMEACVFSGALKSQSTENEQVFKSIRGLVFQRKGVIQSNYELNPGEVMSYRQSMLIDESSAYVWGELAHAIAFSVSEPANTKYVGRIIFDCQNLPADKEIFKIRTRYFDRKDKKQTPRLLNELAYCLKYRTCADDSDQAP